MNRKEKYHNSYYSWRFLLKKLRNEETTVRCRCFSLTASASASLITFTFQLCVSSWVREHLLMALVQAPSFGRKENYGLCYGFHTVTLTSQSQRNTFQITCRFNTDHFTITFIYTVTYDDECSLIGTSQTTAAILLVQHLDNSDYF